ncbi:hypothetical protein SDC9_203699 [bioreactor metagenome]|uniref:Uncharacterized protein n=1 Tax=bioreactor metagenome TaxID=1076179 RepID=A0A645J6B5_9ZZZZ
MTEALNADVHFFLQFVGEFDEFSHFISRNNNVALIQFAGRSFDGFQESTAGFPDGFLSFLGVGDEYVESACF